MTFFFMLVYEDRNTRIRFKSNDIVLIQNFAIYGDRKNKIRFHDVEIMLFVGIE